MPPKKSRGRGGNNNRGRGGATRGGRGRGQQGSNPPNASTAQPQGSQQSRGGGRGSNDRGRGNNNNRGRGGRGRGQAVDSDDELADHFAGGMPNLGGPGGFMAFMMMQAMMNNEDDEDDDFEYDEDEDEDEGDFGIPFHNGIPFHSHGHDHGGHGHSHAMHHHMFGSDEEDDDDDDEDGIFFHPGMMGGMPFGLFSPGGEEDVERMVSLLRKFTGEPEPEKNPKKNQKNKRNKNSNKNKNKKAKTKGKKEVSSESDPEYQNEIDVINGLSVLLQHSPSNSLKARSLGIAPLLSNLLRKYYTTPNLASEILNCLECIVNPNPLDMHSASLVSGANSKDWESHLSHLSNPESLKLILDTISFHLTNENPSTVCDALDYLVDVMYCGDAEDRDIMMGTASGNMQFIHKVLGGVVEEIKVCGCSMCGDIQENAFPIAYDANKGKSRAIALLELGVLEHLLKILGTEFRKIVIEGEEEEEEEEEEDDEDDDHDSEEEEEGESDNEDEKNNDEKDEMAKSLKENALRQISLILMSGGYEKILEMGGMKAALTLLDSYKKRRKDNVFEAVCSLLDQFSLFDKDASRLSEIPESEAILEGMCNSFVNRFKDSRKSPYPDVMYLSVLRPLLLIKKKNTNNNNKNNNNNNNNASSSSSSRSIDPAFLEKSIEHVLRIMFKFRETDRAAVEAMGTLRFISSLDENCQDIIIQKGGVSTIILTMCEQIDGGCARCAEEGVEVLNLLLQRERGKASLRKAIIEQVSGSEALQRQKDMEALAANAVIGQRIKQLRSFVGL